MAGNDHPVLPKPPAAVTRGASRSRAAAFARDAFGRDIDEQPQDSGFPESSSNEPPKKKETATDALGRRAGALSDELDFSEFVASLVHGTFDAIVDSSIRQMESFADLVAAVAKPIDQFTQENVSLNQARDYLVERHPQDLVLVREEDGVRVAPRPQAGGDEDEHRSPDWLRDYGFDGEELTAEFLEEQLLPLARQRVAQGRLQLLSTMVLLGMNRVIVKDGTIGARLRFRAAAADHTRLDYAIGADPNQTAETEWGSRGSRSYSTASTKVSTVGLNVQSDTELKAELFGEVKINFASETLPLDRFVDDARRNVLERHARPAGAGRIIDAPRTNGNAAAPSASAPAPALAPAPAPSASAPAPAPSAPVPAPAAGGAR